MRRPIYLTFLCLVSLAGYNNFAYADEASKDSPTLKPKYMQTMQVMALVKKAAVLVERKGEEAFPEFKKKGSEYFHGDLYVFVDDLKGKILCLPTMPEREGTNIMDITDGDGKRFMAGMTDIVSGEKTAGWVHYRWPRQKGQEPTWKSSYVVRVKDTAGRQYLVGSGLYDMKVEKLFIADTVDDAARLVKKKGKQAFATLRDRAGPFRYQDVYVFVHDQQGTELVNPGFPDLEGTNVIDVKDANGKAIVRETLKLLEKQQAGWIEYMWPKPGSTTPSKKMSYVRKVKTSDRTLYVGAGVY